MHITSINQQLYISESYAIRHSQARSGKYKNRNNANISFNGYKNLEPQFLTIGILAGIYLLTFSMISKCSDKTSDSINNHLTKEYYDATLIKHQYSIFSDEGSDSGRVITRNEREHAAEMNAKKDSLLKDFKYGTKERDNFEKIYRNSYDSITAPHSPSGKKIIYNEWYQTIVDLEDSIKAKYPDKEINVKL